MRTPGSLLALLLCASCASDEAAERPSSPASPPSSEATPPPAADPGAREVATPADAPPRVSLPSGASVPVPPRWTHTAREAGVSFTGPDGQASVTLLERPAASVEEALASAWAEVDPAFSAKDKQSVKPPPDDGYDEILVETYQLADETQFAQAVVLGKGGTGWLFLVRGPLAAVARRGAQLREIMGGLEVPGAEAEKLAGRKPRALDKARAEELRAFLARAREAVGVPGAAVVVVQGGREIFADGFGTTAAGGQEAVTADTRMMIGSITKSMTTLLMGTLVDEGRMTWDTPVQEVYPAFAMKDPKVAEAMHMRHLVCACTGVPRKDMELLFEFADVTPEDIVKSVAAYETTTGFGETFQYSNQMVAVGGFVAGHLARPEDELGPAYDRAMTERVFQPMGLTTATLDFAEVVKGPFAHPHSKNLQGTWKELPLEVEHFVLPLRPSGGVWMSTRDLARYAMTEIARGRSPDGTRVASAAAVEKRWEPQVKASADSSYGLGWGVAEDRGLRVIAHTGGTFGFNAYVVFLPDVGLGLAGMVNGSGGALVNSLAWQKVLELVLDAEPKAEAQLAFALKTEQEARQKALKDLHPASPRELQPWLGR